jgi:hypothetical protein
MKKSKDAFALYWRAYAMGMAGNLTGAIGLFESYQTLRDMDFPCTVALAYFHTKTATVDHEMVEQLHGIISVSEDVEVVSKHLNIYRMFIS